MTVVDALSDPALFASAFADPDSWLGWRAFLAVTGSAAHTRALGKSTGVRVAAHLSSNGSEDSSKCAPEMTCVANDCHQLGHDECTTTGTDCVIHDTCVF